MAYCRAWQTGTIPINTKPTGEINLQGNCDFVQIILPLLTSGTIKLQVSDVTGGTFQDLGDGVTTATTTGSYSTTFKLGGYQYIKVVSSVNQGAERTIKVRGFDI